MINSNAAQFIAPAGVAASQKAHIAAGLDARDAQYLTVNFDRSPALTVAQDYTKRTGKPYTGNYGWISID